KHKRTRRASQPAFKNDALKTYVEMLNPIQERRIQAMPVNEEFIFYDTIQTTLMDVAARVFIGLDEKSPEAQRLNYIFETINKGLITPLPYNIPFTTFSKSLKAREELRQFFKANIPLRRGTDGQDMFTRYCNAQDEDGEYLNDEDIDGHMAFLLFAAFDTTTSALTNILYYLGKNPDWQDKVRNEIFSIKNEMPTFDDVAEMKLTEYVFQETLRFYPSVMILNRRTTRDVHVNGYDIPANTMIMLSPPFTHRMEEWWSNPLEFDPMRFSPERAEHKRHGFSYVPFGGGAHKCIGMHFALMNAKLYLFRLLKNYKVTLRPGYDPAFMHVHLPRPVDGLPITLTKI
ncbi:cytochrome P450, partial [bacterium]|nr:cytochrome P450 [bacterium]